MFGDGPWPKVISLAERKQTSIGQTSEPRAGKIAGRKFSVNSVCDGCSIRGHLKLCDFCVFFSIFVGCSLLFCAVALVPSFFSFAVALGVGSDDDDEVPARCFDVDFIHSLKWTV